MCVRFLKDVTPLVKALAPRSTAQGCRATRWSGRRLANLGNASSGWRHHLRATVAARHLRAQPFATYPQRAHRTGAREEHEGREEHDLRLGDEQLEQHD